MIPQFAIAIPVFDNPNSVGDVSRVVLSTRSSHHYCRRRVAMSGGKSHRERSESSNPTSRIQSRKRNGDTTCLRLGSRSRLHAPDYPRWGWPTSAGRDFQARRKGGALTVVFNYWRAKTLKPPIQPQCSQDLGLWKRFF